MPMYGSALNLEESDLNSTKELSLLDDDVDYSLIASEYFRKKVINAGFYITSLIPVYHQGWEMDEWAANAKKDGKEYFITTNHGRLEVEEVPTIKDAVKEFFSSFWPESMRRK